MREPSLSTHVLDTRLGRPASGVAVTLSRVEGERVVTVAEARTDSQGRIASLAEGLAAGAYRLSFDVGAYFRAQGTPTLFARVTLDLQIAADGGHYHVPLLASPFASTAYRGG